MKTINYKEFVGSVEVSIEDSCLHGKILFINDLVTYEANNIPELIKNFEEAVDEYISTCETLEIEPQKSFSGTFNIRIGEKLHREAAMYAAKNDIKINAVITSALESYLHESINVKEVHNHTNNYTYNLSIKESSDIFEEDNNIDIMENNITATLLSKENPKWH